MKFDISMDEFYKILKKIKELKWRIIWTNKKIMMLQIKVKDALKAKTEFQKLEWLDNVGFNVKFSFSSN